MISIWKLMHLVLSNMTNFLWNSPYTHPVGTSYAENQASLEHFIRESWRC
jgi:hypothetical protein